MTHSLGERRRCSRKRRDGNKWVMWFRIVIILLAVAATAFWVWAIADCAGNEVLEPSERLTWLLIVVLTHWVGALIYVLAARPKNPEFSQRRDFEADGWDEPRWTAKLGEGLAHAAHAVWFKLNSRARSRPLRVLVLAPPGVGFTSWLHGLVLAEGGVPASGIMPREENALLGVHMDEPSLAAQDHAHLFDPDTPTWSEHRLSRALLRTVHSGIERHVNVERVMDLDDVPAFGAEASEESVRKWQDRIDQTDILFLVIDPHWPGPEHAEYRWMARHYRTMLQGSGSLAGSWPYVDEALRALPLAAREDPTTVEARLREVLSLVLQSLGVPAAGRDTFFREFAESVARATEVNSLRDEYLDRIWELLSAAQGLRAGAAGPWGTRYLALRKLFEPTADDASLTMEIARRFAPTMALPEAYQRLVEAFTDPDAVAPLARALRHKRLALVVTKADRLGGFVSASDAGATPYSLAGDIAPVGTVEVRERAWEHARDMIAFAWKTRSPEWASTLPELLNRLRPVLEQLLPVLGRRAQVFFVSIAEPASPGGPPRRPVQPRGAANPWLWALGHRSVLAKPHPPQNEDQKSQAT
jgi:hypothetical protein